MTSANHTWTLIDPKRLMMGLFLAFSAAIIVTLSSSNPASAGGDSGSGSGGGSCSISYGWRFASNWGGFAAAGQSCGSSVYNSGKSRANLAKVGAASCYDNRNTLDAIWYLTGNSANNIWLQYPSAGNPMTSKAYATGFINRSGANAEQKEYGRRAVAGGGTPVVLVCTWPGQRGVTCDDLPEWNTKVKQPGVKPNSRFSSRDAAINNCILACPSYERQANDGAAKRWVRPFRSDSLVPKNFKNVSLNGDTARKDKLRGTWCFFRPDSVDKSSKTDREYRTAGETTEGFETDYFPQFWVTNASGGELGNENPHPGPTKFVDQCRTPSSEDPEGRDLENCGKITPFGELINGAVENNTLPTNESIVDSVVETDQVPRSSFDLTDNNRKALAEGGILNVKESTIYGAIASETFTETPQVRERFMDCSVYRTYEFSYTSNGSANMSGTATRGCNTWGSWGRWQDMGEGESIVDLKLSSQMPQVTGFWQTLANHCYADGYNGAIDGQEALANGDESKNISAAAVTGRMNDVNSPVWGPNSANPETAEDGFFDKECSYAGVRSGEENRSTNTQFRDNEFRTIGVDLFVPESGGVVEYNNEPALTTTVTRWNESTPQPAGISNEGVFRMETANGDVFNADPAVNGETAPVQKNWDTSEFESRNLSIIGGSHSDFQVAGNWPSDRGMPGVFTFKWEYAPMVANTVPVENVGFAGPGGARTFTAGEVAVPVEGKVYSRFDGKASPALPEALSNNTGSGTANNLDGVLYWGASLDDAGRWTMEPDAFQPYYQVLKFVRATTE